MVRTLGGAAVVAALLWPASASATNALRPRTSPTFELEQCLTVIEPDAPTLHVDFSIPFEDTVLGADELPDSRTLQFFALCRDQHAELDALPSWIAQHDLDRALQAGIIAELPPDDDVLDLADAWQGCAHRLVADDARLRISCEDTEGGVDFDATALPAGNYVVRGYTFEPTVNVWVARRGVIQVRDETGPRPVVALMSPPRDDWRAYEADGFEIVGCMDGPPGTTVRVEWASLITLEWRPLATFDAAEGTFSIPFEIPPEAVQHPLLFRGIAEAPSSEPWTAYAPGVLNVWPDDGESDDPEPPPGIDHCGFFPDAPAGTDSTGEGGGSGSDGSTTALDPDTDTAMQLPDAGGGCGCRATSRPRAGYEGALAFVLGLFALGRRRM